jgi:small-conductance mechanosensitive channel
VIDSEPVATTKSPDSIKRRNLIRRIGGLVVCVAAATAAGILNSRGFILLKLTAQHSLMDAIFVLFLCLSGYFALMLLSTLQIHVKHGGESEINMLGSFNRILTGLAILVGFVYILGRLDSFTTFFTMFGGLLLGWALQAPVSGFAAWVMVTLLRPYRIGDRILFHNLGLTGDIVKFSSMYLTLNQVGGSIGSEEPVGRMVHVPNAMLFSQVVINYTHSMTAKTSSYILDEALFRVTYDSDWDTVESILLNTAQQVTAEIIRKTGVQPYVRADTWDYGNLFRLRYMTDATDRPRIMYEIVKVATKEIQRNRNVDLAIPFIYSFKRGLEGTGTGPKIGETVEQVDVRLIHGVRLEDAQYWIDNDQEVNEIARHINEVGLLQPIVLTRDLTGNEYHIQFGEKRLKACMLLGWDKIPAIIKNPIGADINRYSAPPADSNERGKL